MAIQGLKINELTEITTLTDDSVLPAVKVEDGVTANQAGKVSISTLKTYVNTGNQTTANLVTSISSESTDTQYPSAKCVYDILGDIEALLAEV